MSSDSSSAFSSYVHNCKPRLILAQFSQLVVFSLLGVFYESYLTISNEWSEIEHDWTTVYQSLGDLPSKVTKAYISESSYWLSWYPLVAP